jgi:hypothetical protein
MFIIDAPFAEEGFRQLIEKKEKGWSKHFHHKKIKKQVESSNKIKMTLKEIKRLDKEWTEFVGVSDFMKPLLENKCASYLKKSQTEMPFLEEIFVMDNQGRIVCSTNRTSDYWQADEKKWSVPFKTKKSHLSEVEFDESAQSYLIQLSLPLMKKVGKRRRKKNIVFGAVTLGINLEKLKE